MAKTSEIPAGRKRRVHEQLWNDALFRNRIHILADARGISVRTAMREVGFTADYADRDMVMRNSNQVMVLADYFGVSPAYLCGWPDTRNDNPDIKPAPRQKAQRPIHADDRQLAEYREWLGKLIIEMVQIAQQGAGDVYGIAERVLTAAGLEPAQPPRSPTMPPPGSAGSATIS